MCDEQKAAMMEFTKSRLLLATLVTMAGVGQCAIGSGALSPVTGAPAATTVANANQAVPITQAPAAPSGLAAVAETCAANCKSRNFLRPPYIFAWVEMSPSTSWLAATMIHYIDPVTNATRTSLKEEPVPSWVQPPPTDALGTHTEVVSLFFGGTTTVAYPTSYIDWGDDYVWEGVLPTKTAADATDMICSTNTAGATVSLLSHPQPAQTGIPDGFATDDPRGFRYSLHKGYDPYLRQTYATLFPDQAAFALCQNGVGGPKGQPVVNGLTVAWMTTTVTSLESAPAAPAPAQGTPPAAGGAGPSADGKNRVSLVAANPTPLPGGDEVAVKGAGGAGSVGDASPAQAGAMMDGKAGGAAGGQGRAGAAVSQSLGGHVGVSILAPEMSSTRLSNPTPGGGSTKPSGGTNKVQSGATSLSSSSSLLGILVSLVIYVCM